MFDGFGERGVINERAELNVVLLGTLRKVRACDRLSASIWVAGRQNSVSEELCGQAVHCCVAAYRREIHRLAEQPLFSRSFVRLDVNQLAAQTAGSLKAEVARSARRARQRTSDRALPRFTREVDGVRRIIEEPPLITRLPEREANLLAEALDEPCTSGRWPARSPIRWTSPMTGGAAPSPVTAVCSTPS